MKNPKHIVLIALTLTFSLIILTQLVTTQVSADAITAEVDIHPDSLLLKYEGHGNWMTVHVVLPVDYNVTNINMSTVTLEVMGGKIPVSRFDIQNDTLMVKFDRTMVISFLWPMIEHMSPRTKYDATLTVTGNLNNGDGFEGSDTINVFYTQL